ncbi:HigA family addiction module antitoxin [Parapedobacter sp. 10938]|uniref:HigA family addiction module antitoxin n=1 Tax=Parapedobacter flavus TaxID=3110225 RepID=UPI002DB5FE53|nr:HigA family addiction module antitoxin [Parapedobacter sp. 10938]MEC3881837.1 HigA family addiction module antitoxin [Parapedobacter sp. 10938]
MKLIHPGLILREEFEARGLNVTDAANLLQIARPSMSMVLNGRGGISPTLALKIEHYIGGSARFWADLQTAYELSIARENLVFS